MKDLVPVSSLRKAEQENISDKALRERDRLFEGVREILKLLWRCKEYVIQAEIAALLIRLKEDEALTPPEMWWVSAIRKTKYEVVVILKERWVVHKVEFKK